MTLFRQINRFLSRSNWIQLEILGLLITMSGMLEIAGIASIMPFMGIVMNSDLTMSNKFLHWIYREMSFSTPNHFLIFLGTVVLLVLFLSNLVSAITTWKIFNLSFSIGADLSQKIFASYMNQPYLFFLERNSSELVSNSLVEVGRVVTGILIPILTIISRIIVVLSIVFLLIWVNPELAILTGATLGGAYAGIFLLVRKTLTRSGRGLSIETARRSQIAYETMGGIKDIKLLGREKDFYDRFTQPVRLYATYMTRSNVISSLPRYALETLAFGGIIVLVIYLLHAKQGASAALPLISLYALSGYRMMPALQQLFTNLSYIRFNAPSLEKLSKDLEESIKHSSTSPVPSPIANPISFLSKIEMEKIVFHYPNRPEAVLKGVNLSIKANTTVGIVGSTGSGKTTTLDILLGLLTPSSGKLLIDGIPINSENVRNWQASIGYVPQQIMLLDDTILRNIAFGIPDDQVDHDAVIKAAGLAHLHEFIQNDLPLRYNTIVGDRGVRLSGGQRQRIGIARALYHDPSILVLDEATSSLDNITENVIMEALHTLSHQKTIIMVAHRLSTVRECDTIFVMDQGQVSGQGTYEELLGKNMIFRHLSSETSGNSTINEYTTT
ncbi:MAG: ABC transporter ATP-binding protein [Leptospirales bacterium]